MDIEQLRELSRMTADIMKNRMADEGGVVPVIIANATKPTPTAMIIATPWSDEEEKVRMLRVLKMAFIIYGVDSYAQCAEAWMVRRDKDHPLDGRPASQCDDRIEVLHSIAVSHEHRISYSAEIQRDWETGNYTGVTNEQFNEATIGKGEWQYGGRMAELLPSEDLPTLPPYMEEVVRALLDRYLIESTDIN